MGDQKVRPATVVVEGLPTPVIFPTVELDGDSFPGPGKVEVESDAVENQTVILHRKGKPPFPDQPEHIGFEVAVAGLVTRNTIGECPMHGGGSAVRSGSEPGDTLLQSGQVEQFLTQGGVDDLFESSWSDQGGRVNDGALHTGNGETTDPREVVVVESGRSVKLHVVERRDPFVGGEHVNARFVDRNA